jgi:hypothetical protein
MTRAGPSVSHLQRQRVARVHGRDGLIGQQVDVVTHERQLRPGLLKLRCVGEPIQFPRRQGGRTHHRSQGSFVLLTAGSQAAGRTSRRSVADGILECGRRTTRPSNPPCPPAVRWKRVPAEFPYALVPGLGLPDAERHGCVEPFARQSRGSRRRSWPRSWLRLLRGSGTRARAVLGPRSARVKT